MKLDSDQTLQVAQYVPETLSEGPYRRFAIWVQGCSIRCPGCCNSEMQDFHGGKEIQAQWLLNKIVDTPGVEGITILGGEPFDQAASLAYLTDQLSKTGVGVMVFSGYSYKALLKKGGYAQSLLNSVDVLVSGPYRQEKKVKNIRWIGSSNQEVHFLSSRYSDCPEFARPGQSIHISLSEDSMTITGFPGLFP